MQNQEQTDERTDREVMQSIDKHLRRIYDIIYYSLFVIGASGVIAFFVVLAGG